VYRGDRVPHSAVMEMFRPSLDHQQFGRGNHPRECSQLSNAGRPSFGHWRPAGGYRPNFRARHTQSNQGRRRPRC
jgi:hypothetical protein